MTNPPGFRYPNAPIQEASLEVQVTMPEGFDVSRLNLFSDPAYGAGDETIGYSGEFEVGPVGVATRTRQSTEGYRFLHEDEKHVALLAASGFTFARLAPYDCWATFVAEAMRVWPSYAEIALPTAITRIGLRYINQIMAPGKRIDLEDYLRTRPEISEDMPNDTSGFFLSMDIPLPDHEVMCRITETAFVPDEDNIALVLDINVGRMVDIAPDDVAAIGAHCETLRTAKNLVFEASITDKSRRLFY